MVILAILLELIGGTALVFAFTIYTWRRQDSDFWKSLQAQERKEGDTDKVIALLIFIGGLMALGGIALSVK